MGVGVRVRAWLASVLVLVVALDLQQVSAEVLTPPYFNLAEGRRITATATCGEGTEGPELFCKLVPNAEKEDTLLIQGLVCDHCDPDRPDKRHPPEFAVDGSATWWQSPPLSRGTNFKKKTSNGSRNVKTRVRALLDIHNL
ncbi:hypothetical protein LSTR_LSTR015196 [Laodelphax striatellus]|uniref:Laminin N-terminal domain-containing protein n=1 Tax=Laodelphax striatellus TaxID=195883 RepID=A0A482WNF3_LAOST|nr:hypothetical protein LSTR_LSTR015196 [Laodelphax striatellus]